MATTITARSAGRSEDVRSLGNGEDDSMTLKILKGDVPSTSNDETLVEGRNPAKNDRVTIEDWSLTGRGSHVEFSFEETVPLGQDRYLGRGSAGDVYETNVQGWKLAHKRVEVRRKLGASEKKEIEILKRLSSHTHMIQLVGTYTHRQFLGILLYPVAVCDLFTFFEDVEAWSSTKTEDNSTESRLAALDPVRKERLRALAYNFPARNTQFCASLVYSKVGCLVSAIEYLHDQKIRHKDLKPSNILLCKDRLWLSDFGSATDFSHLSQSATDSERGTPRYFSPEVAAWQPNGRAADIFSLGCILLEILVLHDRGSLEHIRQNRSQDPSFHANLDKIEIWRAAPKSTNSQRRHYLLEEVKFMLMHQPAARPTAKQLLTRMTGYDLATKSRLSLFGHCCKNMLIPEQEFEGIISQSRLDVDNLRRAHAANLSDAHAALVEQKMSNATLRAEREAFDARLLEQSNNLSLRLTEMLEISRKTMMMKEESDTRYRLMRESLDAEKKALHNAYNKEKMAIQEDFRIKELQATRIVDEKETRIRDTFLHQTNKRTRDWDMERSNLANRIMELEGFLDHTDKHTREWDMERKSLTNRIVELEGFLHQKDKRSRLWSMERESLTNRIMELEEFLGHTDKRTREWDMERKSLANRIMELEGQLGLKKAESSPSVATVSPQQRRPVSAKRLESFPAERIQSYRSGTASQMTGSSPQFARNTSVNSDPEERSGTSDFSQQDNAARPITRGKASQFGASEEARGHRRSNTVSETVGRMTSMFSGRQPSKSRDSSASLASQESYASDIEEKRQKIYPPESMTRPVSNDAIAAPRRSTESSRRSSFGFSRRSSGNLGHEESTKPSRRFNLLPSSLSSSFSNRTRN